MIVAGSVSDDPLEEKKRLYKKLMQQVQQQSAEIEKLENNIQAQADKLASLSQKGKENSNVSILQVSRVMVRFHLMFLFDLMHRQFASKVVIGV